MSSMASLLVKTSGLNKEKLELVDYVELLPSHSLARLSNGGSIEGTLASILLPGGSVGDAAHRAILELRQFSPGRKGKRYFVYYVIEPVGKLLHLAGIYCTKLEAEGRRWKKPSSFIVTSRCAPGSTHSLTIATPTDIDECWQ